MKLNTFVECTFQRKNFTLYQKSKGDKYLSEKRKICDFAHLNFREQIGRKLYYSTKSCI